MVTSSGPSAAGLPSIDSVTLNGKTIPEVDANYATATAIDVGHGGFGDGLFTKPPVGSYPAWRTSDKVTAENPPPTIRAV